MTDRIVFRYLAGLFAMLFFGINYPVFKNPNPMTVSVGAYLAIVWLILAGLMLFASNNPMEDRVGQGAKGDDAGKRVIVEEGPTIFATVITFFMGFALIYSL